MRIIPMAAADMIGIHNAQKVTLTSVCVLLVEMFIFGSPLMFPPFPLLCVCPSV